MKNAIGHSLMLYQENYGVFLLLLPKERGKL